MILKVGMHNNSTEINHTEDYRESHLIQLYSIVRLAVIGQVRLLLELKNEKIQTNPEASERLLSNLSKKTRIFILPVKYMRQHSINSGKKLFPADKLIQLASSYYQSLSIKLFEPLVSVKNREMNKTRQYLRISK